jgi:hypothetical protein
VVPKARIFHKCARSGDKLKAIGSYYAVRNSLLLVSKHSGRQYCRATMSILGSHLRAAVRAKPGDRWIQFATTLEGACDHLLGRYGRRRGAGGRGRRAAQRAVIQKEAEREKGAIDAASPNQ